MCFSNTRKRQLVGSPGSLCFHYNCSRNFMFVIFYILLGGEVVQGQLKFLDCFWRAQEGGDKLQGELAEAGSWLSPIIAGSTGPCCWSPGRVSIQSKPLLEPLGGTDLCSSCKINMCNHAPSIQKFISIASKSPINIHLRKICSSDIFPFLPTV